MAISNSKSHFATQNALSAPLIILFFFFLLLNNVKSDSVSFNFPSFPEDVESVVLLGDAASSGGALKLTKTDQLGKPIQWSVGLAGYPLPIHLYDKSTGKLADFTTDFSFVVNSKNTLPHGDGFTFSLASIDYAFSKNTTGGFLGLFNPKTAFDPSKNPVVAVEFDSFGNEWDPIRLPVAPHIGIDVQSLKSVKSVTWPINEVPAGAIGNARITYDSKTKELEVVVGYIHDQPNRFASLTLALDLRTVLPEWVAIGFSAATGQDVETHDILSWSFRSNL